MPARSIRLLVVAPVLLCASIATQAGGWVVVTVSDLPDHVVVGKTIRLEYAVRQHGMRLLDDLVGTIHASSGARTLLFPAERLSQPGHYSAALTLPAAGAWTIDIVTGFGGGLDRSRIILDAIDGGAPVPAVAPTTRGQRLFVGKGCITCHVHRALEGRTAAVGANLTAKRYEPEYLRRLLAHPVRREPVEPPNWQMPDLSLSAADIDALVAFINDPLAATSQR